MGLRLRNNLHWCECAGRAVFLDLEQDRYFCLSRAANDGFLELASGAAPAQDAENLHSLVARGLLFEAQSNSRLQLPPMIEAPTKDYLNADAARTPKTDVLWALARELRIAWLLKTRTLDRTLKHIRESRLGPKPRAADERRLLAPIIAAFETVALITSTHNRCLVRALTVYAACRSIGINPMLVFGVTGNPFAAHCWVQLKEAVLVGGFEQARLYTPILVIE